MIIFAAIELTSVAVMAWAYWTAEDAPDVRRSATILPFPKRENVIEMRRYRGQ